MPAERTAKMSDNRRSNKPIMEKRRRARINSCLNDLKALILEALKKDPARHSKLEKADILEMTVKHLQCLHRQQMALTTAANPNVSNKFRAGFKECATEVTRYLNRIEGLEDGIRERLVDHLSSCVNSRGGAHGANGSVNMNTIMNGPVATLKPCTNRNVESLAPGTLNSLQLFPTRLPNGNFALLLPGNYSLAPFTTPTNLLVNNGPPMNEVVRNDDPSMVFAECTSPVMSLSVDTLSLSPASSLDPRLQDIESGYGSSIISSGNVHSNSFGQEQTKQQCSDAVYYRVVEEKTEDVNITEVSCKDSLIKKDPWRPW